MKTSLGTICAVLLALAGAAVAADVSERARRLHEDALVFDAHLHLINRQFYQKRNLGDRYSDGQVDLPRMREGGVDAAFFSLSVSEAYYPERYESKHVLRLLDEAHRQIENNREHVEMARNASDIERIASAGKIAAVLDLEGGFDLDGDVGVLRMFHRLGLRSAQLPAHNWTNEFADSCCAPPKWGGLNEHGRAVIREMNRLGMVINISHAADETIEQAIEVSEDPLVATHHGLRSFNDIPRVMPENLLKKLASKGGLICFHIGHSFHSREYHAWRTKRSGRVFWDTSDVADRYRGKSIYEIDDMLRGRYPSVGPDAPGEVLMSPEEWLTVAERAIEVAGEDHVGLGTDLDGGPTLPKGMKDVSDLPMLTEAMLRRGWPEERIRKFLGGNLLRVFRQITEQ